MTRAYTIRFNVPINITLCESKKKKKKKTQGEQRNKEKKERGDYVYCSRDISPLIGVKFD